jgi:hypothetical protein
MVLFRGTSTEHVKHAIEREQGDIVNVNVRPSTRPKVSQVSYWDNIFEDTAETWKGNKVWAKVEVGAPFVDFYRVSYTIDGVKKSKLFYGESAWNQTERFVYDLGIFTVAGMI